MNLALLLSIAGQKFEPHSSFKIIEWHDYNGAEAPCWMTLLQARWLKPTAMDKRLQIN